MSSKSSVRVMECVSVPQPQSSPNRLAAVVLLLVTAIWGSSFVTSNVALLAGFSPLAVLFWRFLLASVIMGFLYRKRIARSFGRSDLVRSASLGCVFVAAFYLQMLGLHYSSPSNNAIITSANVVFVPFVWWGFTRVFPAGPVFLSCFISLLGIAVISLDFSTGIHIQAGDILSLLAAILFAGQIVMVGEFSKKMDYIVLVFFVFVVATVLAFVFALLGGGNVSFIPDVSGWLAIVYMGVVCTVVCFILQAWCLSRLDSTYGAVIMSTEALFGALLSICAGMDVFSWKIACGGLLLMLAVSLSEVRCCKPKNGQ